MHIDKHFPNAKIGDEIIVSFNISIYNKKSTINKKVLGLVKYKVDELIKIEYQILYNGVEVKPALPITIQFPLYAEYQKYDVILLIKDEYKNVDYKKGNGFITFDLTTEKAIIFIPVDKGINWVIFFSVLGALIVIGGGALAILLIKKKKAKELSKSDTLGDETKDNINNSPEQSKKEMPKNKSKKKKRGNN